MTAVTAFGPGWVNLLGEHTDYNDGLCLPFAIALGVTVQGEPLAGGRVLAQATDLGEDDDFVAAQPPRGAAGWRAFVRGTVGELRDAGHPIEGARLRIAGDVPRGSGLSSSAALSTALALALLALADEDEPDRRALARLCSRVENDWVGAQTGLLDQLAALFGREGHALRLDCCDLSIEAVPLELRGWRLAVAPSGHEHDHAGSGYNERRAECRAACEALGIASLREAPPDAPDALPAPLDRRVRHVLAENARVDAAVAALRDGDLPALGALLDASHASLRDDYEVSVEAVERTVARLKEAGAAGARIVGGGFGGSVLALLPPDAALPGDATVVEPAASARVARSPDH
ncbi:MAG TPA: galactokinase family protein [Solirubrobacteraceae bacterium]